MSSELRRLLYDTLSHIASSDINEVEQEGWLQHLDQLFENHQFQYKILTNDVNVRLLKHLVQFLLSYASMTVEQKQQEVVKEGKDATSLKKVIMSDPQVRSAFQEVNKTVTILLENPQNDQNRTEVHKSVKSLLHSFIAKQEVRSKVIEYTKKLVNKFDTFSKKPLVTSLLEHLDQLDLNNLLRLVTTDPMSFMDKIAHEIIMPVLHKILKEFHLEPVKITLVDNAFSKTTLSLSNIIISVPQPPERIRIRTTSESEFTNNGKIFSSAKISVVSSILIRDVPVIMNGTQFDYDERSLFIELQRKGSFDIKIKSLHTILSLALEKDEEKVVIVPGKEQKCRMEGFSLEFKDVQNSDILNRLTSTFNDQITVALTNGLAKKMSKVMLDTVNVLNELLIISRKFLQKRVVDVELTPPQPLET